MEDAEEVEAEEATEDQVRRIRAAIKTILSEHSTTDSFHVSQITTQLRAVARGPSLSQACLMNVRPNVNVLFFCMCAHPTQKARCAQKVLDLVSL